VTSDNFDLTKNYLERYKYNLEEREPAGNTILSISAQRGSYTIAKLLVMQGADVNTINNSGNTPLHYANWYGYVNISDLLINFGANEKIRNNKGLKPWDGV
jgi:ankyrin repeat protein